MSDGQETAKTPHIPEALIKAQQIANTMDTAVRIPVLGIRLGLDFLVGLIPVLGDGITALIAFRVVSLAREIGVPKALQKRMVRNVILDLALGLVPFVGDIVDLFFKANKANVRMMEKWWLEQNAQAIKETTREQLKHWENQKD